MNGKKWMAAAALSVGIWLAAGIFLPAPAHSAARVWAVSDNDYDEDEATDDEIEDAVNRLSSYYKSLKLIHEDKLTESQLKTLEKICNDARNYIAGTDDIRRAQVETKESETKKLMDDYVAKCLADRPESTSEYLVVGNTYEAPVARYGEEVLVVLPIYNMGETWLTNVVVTPVLSGSVNEWPFEIDRTGYAEEISEIPGSVNAEEAFANHRQVHYTFRTREDVLSGYYKLEFNVVYERDGKAETATLSTYVKTEGAPGSGTIDQMGEGGGKTSTPRIIVTGFETDPAEVYAGSTFQMTVHVKNTSQRTAVSNVEFNLVAAEEGKDDDTLYASFLPTSGSNTIYVPQIPAGGSADLTMEMSAKADLVQKPYAINMTMKYEDDKYNPYENTTSLSVSVRQLSRVETGAVEVLPESISPGGQANVMFSIYNTGKTILYNVKVRFESETVSGGDSYVGKLESGATGNVDTMLTGETPTTDDGMVKAIISYEDDTGKVTEVEEQIPLWVQEEMGGDMGMFPEDMPVEEESTAKWPWIVGGLAALLLVVAATVIVKVRKKKKAQKALAEDLAQLEAEIVETRPGMADKTGLQVKVADAPANTADAQVNAEGAPAAGVRPEDME